MHKLSLHHLTMLRAHPLELVDAAAAAGFDYYGLRLVAPMSTDTIVDVARDPTLVRSLITRMKDTGVALLDIEAVWLQPDTDVRNLLPALDAGRRLGAGHVLAVGFDTDMNRLADNFSLLCDAADQYDMTVGLELITYCSIGTLPQALALIEGSRKSNARLLIDALQFYRSGARAEELDDVDVRLIEYAQLCDAPLRSPVTIDDRRIEARTARLLPGLGQLPLNDLLAHLPADITLAVEAPTVALMDLPFNEQARIVRDQTIRFLGMVRTDP